MRSISGLRREYDLSLEAMRSGIRSQQRSRLTNRRGVSKDLSKCKPVDVEAYGRTLTDVDMRTSSIKNGAGLFRAAPEHLSECPAEKQSKRRGAELGGIERSTATRATDERLVRYCSYSFDQSNS